MKLHTTDLNINTRPDWLTSTGPGFYFPEFLASIDDHFRAIHLESTADHPYNDICVCVLEEERIPLDDGTMFVARPSYVPHDDLWVNYEILLRDNIPRIVKPVKRIQDE